MKLSGRRIVITGASRGLGRALARRFARDGASLALCSRDGRALKVVAEELKEIGSKVLWKECDVGNSRAVGAFASDVLDEFDSVDVLVNNASAIAPRKNISEYSVAEWNEIIRVNINGLFYVVRSFLPGMMKKKSGMIINVSSSVGRAPRAQWGAYSVSKFGLEGFTLLLAEELKPYAISVNSVNPGPMATEMRRIVHPEENQDLLNKPEMLTDLFVYLASDDGAGISGQQFDATKYIAQPQEKP